MAHSACVRARSWHPMRQENMCYCRQKPNVSEVCGAEIRSTVFKCLRTASVQGIKVSLAFNPVEQDAVLSLLNPGEQNLVMLWLLYCPAPL